MLSAGEAGPPFDGMPISPELILVSSPEERQRARELLPPTPAEDWDLLLSGIRARAALQPVEPIQVARARKPRRMLVLASLALVAVAVPIGMAGARDNVTLQRVAKARGQRSASRAVPPVTFPATPVSPATRPHVKPKAKAAKRPAAPRTTGQKSASPKVKAKTANGPTAPRVSGFVPSRVWGWVAQPGPVTYLFRLYRNGRQVYAARTKQAQLMLPKSFRFAAGTYRWSVVALGKSKAQSPKPLVESTFVLSPGAAANANG